MTNKPVSVRIEMPQNEKELLRAFACKNFNNNMSQLIRVATKKYIEDFQSKGNANKLPQIGEDGKNLTLNNTTLDMVTKILDAMESQKEEMNERYSKLEEMIIGQKIGKKSMKKGGTKYDF